MNTRKLMAGQWLRRGRGWQLAMLLGAALVAGSAAAGLYPPAAPPGSAFVRVFNGTTQAKVSAQIGDKSINDVQALQASGFVFLAPGEYTLQVGGASQKVSLAGDRSYTAALEGGGIHVFEQSRFGSQLKALVAVFNLIDGTTLGLKTADGKTAVVDGVAAQSLGSREVNPVSATLAVYNGADKLADARPVTLERGKVSSLFVTGSAANPLAVWVTE